MGAGFNLRLPSLGALPSGPAVSPPVIRPEEFENYPTFRETFLLYFPDAKANAAMRSFGLLLHELVLNFWDTGPPTARELGEPWAATRVDRMWIEASLDQRQRLQRVLWPDGLRIVENQLVRTSPRLLFFDVYGGSEGSKMLVRIPGESEVLHFVQTMDALRRRPCRKRYDETT